MEKMDGVIAKTCVDYKDFPQHVNEEVVMKDRFCVCDHSYGQGCRAVCIFT